MGQLEDTFGEEFANHVQQRTQERRAERERLSDETKRKIAHLVINEGKFGEGDPMFSYTSEEGVQHDVLLMELADPASGSVWSQVNELESGAISLPLEYLGQWVWSIFNDPSMAKQMEEDEYYVVAGRLDEWERDDGTTQDQFSPVRGVIGLEEAKKLAAEALEEEGFTSPEVDTPPEPPSEPEEEPEEEEEDTGGLFGGSPSAAEEEEEDEDEAETVPATYSDVANVVEELGEEEPEVWDVTAEHSELDTLLLVVCDRLDGVDYENEAHLEKVKEIVLDRVGEGPPSEEEETETDRLFG